MCMEAPVRLDHRKDLITDTTMGQAPKNWRSRHMVACLISGRSFSDRDDTELESTELKSLHQV